MTPATRIIDRFGGPAAVAQMLGVHITNVHRWTYPKTRTGGTGGRIPVRYWETLLTHAKERRIRLKLSDFFESEAA